MDQTAAAVSAGCSTLLERDPDTTELLDSVYQRLIGQPGSVAPALDALAAGLLAARRGQSATEWEHTVAACRAHPLRSLLHEDPLTARAFAMSRGYQGDAGLLDIIYDREYQGHWPVPVTPLGDAIFRYTIDCQAPAAVRERRRFLATPIDDVCARNPTAHILSVACGHLRELELSRAVQSGSFGRLVGLDQDHATLDVVRRTWGHRGVEAIPASVTTFLVAAARSPQFDFVYAAGLYDYLTPGVAEIVTAKLLDSVRPGGRLLIGNYTWETHDAGYMEAFMGWRLLYRDANAMLKLGGDRRVANASVIPDSTGAVIYLDLDIR